MTLSTKEAEHSQCHFKLHYCKIADISYPIHKHKLSLLEPSKPMSKKNIQGSHFVRQVCIEQKKKTGCQLCSNISALWTAHSTLRGLIENWFSTTTDGQPQTDSLCVFSTIAYRQRQAAALSQYHFFLTGE